MIHMLSSEFYIIFTATTPQLSHSKVEIFSMTNGKNDTETSHPFSPLKAHVKPIIPR